MAPPSLAVAKPGTLRPLFSSLHRKTPQSICHRQGRRCHPCILPSRLNRPTPRLAAGTALRGQASACVDISDGLLADLAHICTASKVGAEIEAAWLPRSSALLQLHDETTALHFAMSGGDDYELCFTVPASRLAEVQADLGRLGCGVTKIGRIVEGEGVRVRGSDGAWLTADRSGWEHFA